MSADVILYKLVLKTGKGFYIRDTKLYYTEAQNYSSEVPHLKEADTADPTCEKNTPTADWITFTGL